MRAIHHRELLRRRWPRRHEPTSRIICRSLIRLIRKHEADVQQTLRQNRNGDTT